VMRSCPRAKGARKLEEQHIHQRPPDSGTLEHTTGLDNGEMNKQDGPTACRRRWTARCWHPGTRYVLEGRLRDRGLVVAAMSEIHPSRTRGDKIVFVGEALVEVPRATPRPGADAAHGQFRQRCRTEEVQARFQKAAAAVGHPAAALDAALLGALSH